MRVLVLALPLALVTASAALAQTTAAPLTPAPAAAQANDHGVPLPALPSPELPPGSKPSDYLRAAQSSLATGNLGETEQALEMAQTRILDRSVPLFQTNAPSDNPATRAISDARQALAAHDRPACMQAIQAALAATAAQGM